MPLDSLCTLVKVGLGSPLQNDWGIQRPHCNQLPIVRSPPMSLTFVEQVHELRLLSVSASHISMQFVDISCAVNAWKIKRSSSIVKAPPAALLLTFQQVYIPWSPSLPYYLMHCRIAALLYQDYIANSHNASNYKTALMLPMTFGSTSNGLTLSRNLSAYLGLRS